MKRRGGMITLTIFSDRVAAHDGDTSNEWPLALALAVEPSKRRVCVIAFGNEALSLKDGWPGHRVVDGDDPWWSNVLAEVTKRIPESQVDERRSEICVVHALECDPKGQFGIQFFLMATSNSRPMWSRRFWMDLLWQPPLVVAAGEGVDAESFAAAVLSAAAFWRGRLRFSVGNRTHRVLLRVDGVWRYVLNFGILAVLVQIRHLSDTLQLVALGAAFPLVLAVRLESSPLHRAVRRYQLETVMAASRMHLPDRARSEE